MPTFLDIFPAVGYNGRILLEEFCAMKKWLSILLSLCLIVSLTACGGATQPEGWYSEEGINLSKKQVQTIVSADYTTPKNVILIIGDGMGPNDIALAEEHVEGVYDYGTVLNLIPNHGLSTTHSASDAITDSAAAATALSTGTKTNNGTIGKDPDGNDLMTMAERARAAGKKVGIVTDDLLSGATPTAFTVHSADRDNTAELVNAMIKFTPDVMMCQDYTAVFAPMDTDARKIFNETYLVAKKFDKFTEVLDTDPNSEKPFFGFLNGYATVPSDNLAQCAQVAFKRLQNDNGFFLMIESCGTDKYGQNNNINGKLNSVVTLDRAVAAALLFMQDNPDTLLIITSDHETGGVRMPAEGESLSTALTVNEHTATPVRVFAVGKGSEYFKDATVDNTDIAKFIIKAIDGE